MIALTKSKTGVKSALITVVVIALAIMLASYGSKKVTELAEKKQGNDTPEIK